MVHTIKFIYGEGQVYLFSDIPYLVLKALIHVKHETLEDYKQS